jgi:ABC-type sulfate/molybdate transport systems ATPase subunit
VTPVLRLTGIQKRYQSLRPLRLQELVVGSGERVAISGFDAGAGEVLVNLITGASLPDQGEVRVLGQLTADIAGGDEWLASLDRFGLVSPRGVLLDGATIEQNMAMSITLQIEPVPPEVVERVRELARTCGIERREAGSEGHPFEWLPRVAGEAPAHVRARVHLARAVALAPALLLLEHPAADLPAGERTAFAETLAAVTDGGPFATLVITNDDGFAKRAAPRALRLDAVTGALAPIKRGWFR